MTEYEIMSIVDNIIDLSNSNIISSSDGFIHPSDLHQTIKVSNNAEESGFKFSCSIDSIQAGAIIKSLLLKENIKTTLKEFKNLKSDEPLYLHYLADK